MFKCDCGYETEDSNAFVQHLMMCDTMPEEKWGAHIKYGSDQIPEGGSLSEDLEEK